MSNCPDCGEPLNDHPSVDVSNTNMLYMCQVRSRKWQRVEPGTVIPAGQPYRVERWDTTFGARASEYVDDKPHDVRPKDYPVFIDSSWRPPLELPTEPTWGIVRFGVKDSDENLSLPRRWIYDGILRGVGLNGSRSRMDRSEVIDFIPLTDEQVARIEAAR